MPYTIQHRSKNGTNWYRAKTKTGSWGGKWYTSKQQALKQLRAVAWSEEHEK